MGPLQGLRVIEMAGVGPAPFAAMLLADTGAQVLCIEREAGGEAAQGFERLARAGVLGRGRQRLALDLKRPEAARAVLDMVASADALIEGFRPGVMERLGLGPEPCLERNPRLVYGRITGWGQYGPLAQSAGHDINYIALSGALHAIGRADAPVPPLNLLGDFGGGAMLLAFGLVCALLEARGSGRGQVVDAAMTDGSALLMAMTYGLQALGRWADRREANVLDGAAPFYGTYACADGRWLAVGALEERFHDALLDGLGLPREEFAARWDPAQWPRLRARLAAAFAAAPREHWCRRFAGTDACVTPVLDLHEAPLDEHNRARATFAFVDGHPQPAPAPRFSRTPAAPLQPEAAPDAEDRILRAWGVPPERIDALRAGPQGPAPAA
jgi:alpha-methylacyl-CoA racemase